MDWIISIVVVSNLQRLYSVEYENYSELCILKKASVTYFKGLFLHFPGGTTDNENN
jgi:hypothetical protein